MERSESELLLSGRSGVTLIELLIAITVTGILAAGLVQVIRQTSDAIKTNRTISKILGNLRSAGQKMTNEIRTIGRSAEDSRKRYRLIGVDGDGGFEDQITTSGRQLSSPANGDHLHMHAEFPDETSGDTHLICFFLNDGSHRYLEDRKKDGDNNPEWGIIRRDRMVDRSSFFSDPNDRNATNITDMTEANPIGYNVDYLSFRYFDRDHGSGGEWFNSWNSHDTSLVQVDKVPEYPDAIEVALRGYDPFQELDPRWYYATVGFNRKVVFRNRPRFPVYRRLAILKPFKL